VRLGGIANAIAAEIEERTGYETRVTILGHVQRGGTPTAFDRVLSTRFGIAAIDAVHDGAFGQMVALRAGEIVRVPLSEAVGTLKTVDPALFHGVAKSFGEPAPLGCEGAGRPSERGGQRQDGCSPRWRRGGRCGGDRRRGRRGGRQAPPGVGGGSRIGSSDGYENRVSGCAERLPSSTGTSFWVPSIANSTLSTSGVPVAVNTSCATAVRCSEP
jgi:hypothetical protein